MSDDADETMRRFRKDMAEVRAKTHRAIMDSVSELIITKFIPRDLADAARLHLRDALEKVYEVGRGEGESFPR